MTEHLNQVPLQNVKIRRSFFADLMNTAADNIIPYQWEALNDRVPDAAPSYCMRNFKAAAKMLNAPHDGCVFQDSDLAKWLEAAAYMLTWRDDPETQRNMDEAIDILEKAQREDGYLDTYYILNGIDKRWTNLRDNHELYCAGHMLEAAVAYYCATGKRKLLDIMIKYVNHIASVFGREPGKMRGYPGHEEIELALVKLYEVTGDRAHLDLAKYFIDERGQEPSYFDIEAQKRGDGGNWVYSVYSDNRYYQAGKPVRQQKHALGHAVRQLYLLSGMADVARETDDEKLKAACETMWKDITRRQMYITGALGQTRFGEAFTFDYDLPNDTVYGETCASLAMVFFAQRMLRLNANGEYGDVLDTLLYNGTISGMNLEGNRFFYVNPLESWPERSAKSQIITHIKSERQKWFGCACCPPNLARTICSLPGYVYLTQDNTAYMSLFTGSDAEIALAGGTARISTETAYPYDGRISIKINAAPEGFVLALRVPGWVKSYELTVNGKNAVTSLLNGFVYIDGLKAGDCIEYVLDMPVCVVRAHPKARANAGKIAIRRGPVVYCLEEIDNGANLSQIEISPSAEFKCEYRPELLKGVAEITVPARRVTEKGWDEYELYADDHEPQYEEFTARLIPYYAWNNRGVGEMCVWVRAY